MKTQYFTAETIQHKSELFLQQVAQFRRNRANYSPERSALLILDMQEYFLNPRSHAYVPSGEAILGGVLQLIDRYRSLHLPVYLTRHVNTKEDAHMMRHWWRDLITPEHPFNEVIPALDIDGVPVIEKTQYDAFYGTVLDKELSKNGVTQVVITGVMTHLCCETTARSAFIHGFEVFFPVDGTATYNEHFHLSTLINLAHGFAHIVRMGDLLEALDEQRPRV